MICLNTRFVSRSGWDSVQRARVRIYVLYNARVMYAVGGDARRPARRVALVLWSRRSPLWPPTRAGHESAALARNHTAWGAARHPGGRVGCEREDRPSPWGQDGLARASAPRPRPRAARHCRTSIYYCVRNTGRLRDVCCDFKTQQTSFYIPNSNTRTSRCDLCHIM